MRSSEIKKLIISSLEDKPDNTVIASELQESMTFDFRDGFTEKVLDRIFSEGTVVTERQYEFDRNLNIAFYGIALSAVAAILLLMLSIFVTEGSLSFDTLLGLSDGDSESIVCLLTGN